MRQAGKIVARVLQTLTERVKSGIKTRELDEICAQELARHKAKPSFKGYRGFPAASCVSVNEEVVHGIPAGSRKLAGGDIVSIDVGVRLRGYCGDAAVTFPVGQLSPRSARLLGATVVVRPRCPVLRPDPGGAQVPPRHQHAVLEDRQVHAQAGRSQSPAGTRRDRCRRA